MMKRDDRSISWGAKRHELVSLDHTLVLALHLLETPARKKTTTKVLQDKAMNERFDVSEKYRL